jgi:hypothetical protein
MSDSEQVPDNQGQDQLYSIPKSFVLNNSRRERSLRAQATEWWPGRVEGQAAMIRELISAAASSITVGLFQDAHDALNAADEWVDAISAASFGEETDTFLRAFRGIRRTSVAYAASSRVDEILAQWFGPKNMTRRDDGFVVDLNPDGEWERLSITAYGAWYMTGGDCNSRAGDDLISLAAWIFDLPVSRATGMVARIVGDQMNDATTGVDQHLQFRWFGAEEDGWAEQAVRLSRPLPPLPCPEPQISDRSDEPRDE